MRRAMMMVVGAVLSVTVVGVPSAQAQTDNLRSGKRDPLSLRFATTTPTRGFEAITVGRDQKVYVAPRGGLVKADITSATAVPVRDGSVVDLVLTPEAARRVGTMVTKNGVDHVAVYVNGEFQVLGSLAMNASAATATLSELSSAQAQRLSRLVNLNVAIPAGPTIKLVAERAAIAPDSGVRIDVFVEGGVADLRAYQVNLSVVGGSAGQLTLERVNIESTRPDFVFGTRTKVDATDQAGGRMASALMTGGVSMEKGYLGSYMLRASADALGTFQVEVATGPSTSALLNSSSSGIPFSTQGLEIAVGTRPTRKPSDH